MKIKILMLSGLLPVLCYAQSQTRDNAGLQGNAGATSGFFETYNPVNYPSGASSWWHLLDVRHTYTENNYAMQFAGSFFDQNLFFRKTSNNPATSWSRVLMEENGKVNINTTAIIGNTAGNNYNENLRLPSSSLGYSCIAFGAVAGISGTGPGQWALVKHPGNVGSKFTIRYINDDYLHILTDGNIGIGTATPAEKLSVNGKIRAKEIKVEATNWPDYVFEEDYQVGTLEALERYLKTHKHLPEMPSAKEVEENGIAVGELVKLQQKKIEELTLYLIEKDKLIRSLLERMTKVESQMQKK